MEAEGRIVLRETENTGVEAEERMVLRGAASADGACAAVVSEVAVELSDGERWLGCTANPAK